MYRYCLAHVAGRLPFALTFWVNFIALGLALHVVGVVVRRTVASDADATFVIALAWFVFAGVAVYGWQVVGVWRASERAMLDYAPTLWVRGAQAAVLVSVLFRLGQALDVVQLGYLRYLPPPGENATAPRYRLSVMDNGATLHLHGAIDFGVTVELSRMIDSHESIELLELDSDGGRVSVARGLARVVFGHGLNTHVRGRCLSACTLVFAGGHKRSMHPEGKLGFHSYDLQSPYLPMYMDPAEELRKDLAYLRDRGIESSFLERIAETPPSDMWYPSHQELMSAAFVHEIETLR